MRKWKAKLQSGRAVTPGWLSLEPSSQLLCWMAAMGRAGLASLCSFPVPSLALAWVGNASDSHLLCWEAALLIGSFMPQASSAVSLRCAGATPGSTDRLARLGVLCAVEQQAPRLEELARWGCTLESWWAQACWLCCSSWVPCPSLGGGCFLDRAQEWLGPHRYWN